jgi:hypothetical protein
MRRHNEANCIVTTKRCPDCRWDGKYGPEWCGRCPHYGWLCTARKKASASDG